MLREEEEQKALHQSSLEMRRAGTRSCVACSVRKGPIFLMFCSANLHDHAVFVNWCCTDGVVGKMRSSVFARLSCRGCCLILSEMSVSHGWIIWLKLCVISIKMVGKTMCLYDGTQ